MKHKFKVLKENEIDLTSDFETLKIESKVKETILENISDIEHSYYYSLVDCESPIEQLLALELENINILNIRLYNPFIDVISIIKQDKIVVNGSEYRVDFVIPVVYKNQENKMFIIECDGYEFHRRTKEEDEYENKRERDLQIKGYEIIRFSGVEIWHRPRQCAEEVIKIILSKCKYVIKNE